MDPETLLMLVALYARLVLGGALCWAGIVKLRRREEFNRAVSDFDLLPGWLESPAARFIPLLELGLGSVLVVGLGTRWAAVGAVLLLAAFTLGIVLVLRRGRQPDCMCFGSSGSEVGWWSVHRNLGLMILAGMAAIPGTSALSIEVVLGGEIHPTPALDQHLAGVMPSVAAVVVWLLIGEALRFRGVTERKYYG